MCEIVALLGRPGWTFAIEKVHSTLKHMRSRGPEVRVHDMCCALHASPMLALCQVESTSYVFNHLLRDGDWASMDRSVEPRTPLVDVWLLREVQSLLAVFSKFPDKRLLAEAPDNPLPEELINRCKTESGTTGRTWFKQIEFTSVGHVPGGAWSVQVVRRYARATA